MTVFQQQIQHIVQVNLSNMETTSVLIGVALGAFTMFVIRQFRIKTLSDGNQAKDMIIKALQQHVDKDESTKG